MILTKLDLDKIRQYIVDNGIKDSEFELLETIDGNEFFTIVSSDGTNKRISSTILYNMFLLGVDPETILECGIPTVKTEEELELLTNKKYGNLIYVIDSDKYYSFSSRNQWEEILKVYIGSEEPKDPNVLWIDFEDENTLDCSKDSALYKLLKAVKVLQSLVDNIVKIATIGVVPGDVSNSYRVDLSESDIPEEPEASKTNEVTLSNGIQEIILSNECPILTSLSGPDIYHLSDVAAGSYTISEIDERVNLIVINDLKLNDETIVNKAYVTIINEGFNASELFGLGIDALKFTVVKKASVNMDPNGEEKPDSSEAEATVNAVCAKNDTAINFALNKRELYDGELLFYTDKKKLTVYYQGRFYSVSVADSTGSEIASLDIDLLLNTPIEHLIFSYGNHKFQVKVNDEGLWTVVLYNDKVTEVGSPITKSSVGGVYISPFLSMNAIFCGGNGSEECLCSHNFVELSNADTEDINLKGLYLLYTDGSRKNSDDIGYIWKVLSLEGVIKAGSTFTIRGARCNSDNESFIIVDSYDMEWYDEEELITFKLEPSSFYLCVGEGFKEDLSLNKLGNPWNTLSLREGYIDSCGFGTGSVGEGSSTFVVKDDWNKIIFARWFMLDPCKLANKAYASRKTTNLWTYINLDKQTTKGGNSIQYYYSDTLKKLYTPLASYKKKDFFTNKTKFNPSRPNMINITFGILATDNGKGATRCFNWVSVGNYDEFIEYRKKGLEEWTKVYSITEGDSSNSESINKFILYYRRYRWCTSYGEWVTTHKCIIGNLSAGEYQYRVGRDEDNQYVSSILSFKVHSNSEVSNFSFILTSDELGFNWAEYTAWKKSSFMINKEEDNYNFTINTGDITLNGNRVNEWMDYYDGRQYIRDKEEMFTIGNNDLCGHISTLLTNGEDSTSKYNHINVLRYFTFELDPNNDYFVSWNNNEYPIYSLYSFNYGSYHFVSINSEIALASSKMYKDWQSNTEPGDPTFASECYAKIEKWLKKDLLIWKGISDDTEPMDCSKCIIYMHEMPFTIVTWSFMSGSSARLGSHLNTLNSNGQYRFSRLFKKYGIRLVIGGHKHTYCITKPIYDAPDGYISNGKISLNANLMGNVDSALSRRPVILVLKLEDVLDGDFARYEVVDKITAPTYVMCQATGYKLVSNKEQPSGTDYIIPWLLAYFKAKTNAATPTENVALHYPMYIRYDLSPSNIKVTAKLIHNIWTVDVNANKSSFNMNSLPLLLSVEDMTLSTTSENDKKSYNIDNIESYKITL